MQQLICKLQFNVSYESTVLFPRHSHCYLFIPLPFQMVVCAPAAWQILFKS